MALTHLPGDFPRPQASRPPQSSEPQPDRTSPSCPALGRGEGHAPRRPRLSSRETGPQEPGSPPARPCIGPSQGQARQGGPDRVAEWSLPMSVGEHSWLWQPAQGSKSEDVGSHPEAAPGGTRTLVGQTQRGPRRPAGGHPGAPRGCLTSFCCEAAPGHGPVGCPGRGLCPPARLTVPSSAHGQ